MRVLKIPRDKTGIRTWIDISSPSIHKEILFTNDTKFAVVFPDHYEKDSRLFHTLERAQGEVVRLRAAYIGLRILDYMGKEYWDCDVLVKTKVKKQKKIIQEL